jgi:hypothetical protein
VSGRGGKPDNLRENAVRRIAQRARTITETFPQGLPPEVRQRFIKEAQTAIELYVAWLPPVDEQEIDRRGLPAHRPTDGHRHGLIGDLYDAYMTMRGDILESRGFARTANAVLRAAGLPKLTDHDFADLRLQRRLFSDYVEKGGKI